MKKTAAILTLLLTGFVFFAAGVMWEGRARPGVFVIETSPVFAPPVADTKPAGLMDVNAASARELADLPGIGPVLAQRIIDYREQHGPLAAPEDLLGVKGIGEVTLDKLRPYILVMEEPP